MCPGIDFASDQVYNGGPMEFFTPSVLEPAAPTGPSVDPLSSVGPYVPVPSNSSIPLIRTSSSLTTLVCDERVISRLLQTLLHKGGLSVGEAARRMGVTTNSIRQYIRGRRNRPSLIWFIKFAELCGAKIIIEFPGQR